MPSTNAAGDAAFSDVLPVSILAKAVTERDNSKKVHSIILTSTPMKAVLEKKKRIEKYHKEERYFETTTGVSFQQCNEAQVA